MTEGIFLITTFYDPAGVLVFEAREPELERINFLNEEREAGSCIHEFAGKTMTIWVITPLEITRDHALAVATTYAETRKERIVDWRLLNHQVPKETREFLRRRFEQTHKLKPKQQHHDRNHHSSTEGE